MKKTTLLGLLTLGLMVLSCTTTPTDLVTRTESYRDKTFRISGRVDQALTVPGTTLTVYLLGDGTSSVAALSLEVRKPGDQVSFDGRIIGPSTAGAKLSGEDKRTLRSLLEQHKIVAPAFLDFTVEAAEKALMTLGNLTSRVWFVLEL